MQNEKEFIEKLFYIVTPELVRKYYSLEHKYRNDPDFINIVKIKLNIDENLALYLQAHSHGFDGYFNEDFSVRFEKNRAKNIDFQCFDDKGNTLPYFENETIYIKKTDLI